MKDDDSRYYTAESDHIISRLVRYRALEGHVQCPVVRLRVDSNPRFLALRDKQSTQAVNTLHDFTLLSSIIKNSVSVGARHEYSAAQHMESCLPVCWCRARGAAYPL